MQRGGTSKDTWITSPHVPSHQSLLKRTTSSKDLVRGNTYLSSRMVENLFWFGRYTVRNQHMTRLLRTAIHFLLEFSERRAIEWPTVHYLCVWYGLMPMSEPPEESHDKPEDETGKKLNESSPSGPHILSDEEIEALLIKAVFSRESTSLAGNIQQFYQLSFNLRERLSGDNWRIINQMSQRFKHVELAPDLAQTLTYLDDASSSLTTLTGFTLDGMTRDQGWRFMSIGRRIERLQFLSILLQQALTMPAESNLDWLLELTDSIVTYRARYSAQPEWLPVLDLLLMDDNNPNSMSFQLKGLIKYLAEISRSYLQGEPANCLEASVARQMASLQALDPDLTLYHGSAVLLSWLADTYRASVELSEVVSLRFFSYSNNPGAGYH
jgi:uncharacterized alpha-E superfamily protein